MPGLLALSVWCALRAARSPVAGRWALAAGLLLGAAWSVRESALLMAPVLLLAGRRAGRRALVPGLAGLAAVPLAAVGVFGALAGRPLQPLTATAGAGEWTDPLARLSLDGSYLALVARQALQPGSLVFLLLPALAIAVAVLAVRRDGRALLPVAWLAWAALYLEIGTLVNLAKPARFLTLCTVPAALLVALALDRAPFAALAPLALAIVACLALAPLAGREHRADDVLLANRVARVMRGLPPGPVLAESYTWWARLNTFLARDRLPVPRVRDPAFLDAAARRARRRLVPLPRPGDYAGGYVVLAPVHPRAGWPTNWGLARARIRADVPWSSLVAVAHVGEATIFRWP
jgi:hypothetical protein